MCELFGMSARVPTTVTLSLGPLAAQGGQDGPHRDGWGVAYYEGGDVRRLRGEDPASESPWIRFLRDVGLTSDTVVAHIRWAQQGEVALRNTHPFARELGGRMHVFAHNGMLRGVREAMPLDGPWRPIGETDSEHAFCALLQRLRPLWREVADGGVPDVQARLRVLDAFAAEARALGTANFLYSDGDLLVAHGHRRRQESDGQVRPPGLHVLTRACASDRHAMTGGGVDVGGEGQQVLLFASVPLTDETWVPLPEGQLVAARAGTAVVPEQG